jgi:hypothetical protein
MAKFVLCKQIIKNNKMFLENSGAKTAFKETMLIFNFLVGVLITLNFSLTLRNLNNILNENILLVKLVEVQIHFQILIFFSFQQSLEVFHPFF